jgi:hypothetical protein
MEKVALLNRAPPIFSLDNYFVFDSTRLKLPIDINLMPRYFALQDLVLFNGYGCDFFLIVNGLKDSLHQLFIGNARVFLLFSHYRFVDKWNFDRCEQRGLRQPFGAVPQSSMNFTAPCSDASIVPMHAPPCGSHLNLWGRAAVVWPFWPLP